MDIIGLRLLLVSVSGSDATATNPIINRRMNQTVTKFDATNDSSCRRDVHCQVWGERRDSNPRFPEPQSGALPLGHAHHRYDYSLEHVGMVVKNMRWSCGLQDTSPQLHLDVSYPLRRLLPRPVETTPGRSGRGSSPCPTRPRSRSRTPPARRRTRRPPRGRGARSSSRIPGPPRWPST